MFSKSLVAVGLIAASCVSALTITAPGSGGYWIFGKSNTISWTFNKGDANPISITVTNPDNSLLNGAFSIAQNVQVSQKSYTVTDVTLKPGDGYIVNFVNATNPNQTYVSSSSFSVEPAGYGVTTLTTLSYSVSGSVTESFTVTETLTGSGYAAGTGSINGNGTATNGTLTGSSTSSATQGPATAQIIQKKTAGGASTTFVGSTAGVMLGLAGVFLGAIVVL